MKKLADHEVPKAWAALATASAHRLLRTEAKNILRLRTVARHVHHELVSRISHMSRAAAMSHIVHARKEMAEKVAVEIRAIRGHARESALQQVRAELAQVVRELPHRHREQVRVESLTKSDREADAASADTAAHSLATAWAGAVLALIVPGEDEDHERAAAKAQLAMQHLDSRVKRIGATETAQAYNDQHQDSIEAALEDDAVQADFKGSETETSTHWKARLFRYWNAVLDRKTCAECRAHDGELVPVGLKFGGGDSPGDVHPMCRCTDSLVFMPLTLGKSAANREPEEDDEGDVA